MKNWFKFQKPTRIEGYIFGLVGVIILAAFLIWGVASWMDSLKSYPLDDKLVYLGKETPPCNIGFASSGFNFGLCKKHQFENYYYATDLSFANVVKNFSHASPSSGNGLFLSSTGNTSYAWSSLKNIPWQKQVMQFKGGEADWYFTYYDDGVAVTKALSRPPTKAHAISIDASDYDAIRKYGL